MEHADKGIVKEYADHLARKASSAVATLSVAGAIGGAALGSVPGLLSHSVISPGANYFAVLLGAIAGAFAGRSLGERRAVGLRLEARFAAHLGQVAQRPAPVAATTHAMPAPAPVATPVVPAPAPLPSVLKIATAPQQLLDTAPAMPPLSAARS